MFQYSAITSYGLAALSGSITDDNTLKVTRIEYGDGIIEELKTIDISRITPIEALNTLYVLQEKVK